MIHITVEEVEVADPRHTPTLAAQTGPQLFMRRTVRGWFGGVLAGDCAPSEDASSSDGKL